MGGRVFIAHAPEDTPRCADLLAALDAWGLDYWFDDRAVDGAEPLTPAVQQALAACDVFLRIGTPATQRSLAVSLQASAFRGLLDEVTRRQRNGRARALVTLILDHGYEREPFDKATLFIDATSRARAAWLADLGRALGVISPLGRRLSRRATLVLGGAATLALASSTSAAIFLQDARTPHPQPPKPGSVRWSFLAARPDQFGAPPPSLAVSGAVVYLVSRDGTMAFPASRPGDHALWSNKHLSNAGSAPMLIAGGTLYAFLIESTNSNQSLYALDARTGAVRWNMPTGPYQEEPSLPALADGAVFVASADGSLYAYDADDGALRWRVPTGDAQDAGLAAIATSTPAASGGMVCVGSLDHSLYAFDTHSGEARWRFPTGGFIISTPALAGGVVYVGSADGCVYAIDASSGKERWRYLAGGPVLGSPTVAAGTLYIAAEDGFLYALDAATGERRWYTYTQDDVSTAPESMTRAPAVAGGVVCVGVYADVAAYGASDGARFWRVHTGSGGLPATAPTLAGGVAYFGGADGKAYAINA